MWASIDSPLVTISTALPKPTIRDARAVPPQPGKSPSLTSGKPNCVFGVDGHDPPIAPDGQFGPAADADAVDRGHGDGTEFATAGRRAFGPRWHMARICSRGASNEAANSRRSAPAMNEPGLPLRMITPRRSVRFSRSSRWRSSSASTVLDSTLAPLSGIVEREHRDVGFGKMERQDARVCHGSKTS